MAVSATRKSARSKTQKQPSASAVQGRNILLFSDGTGNSSAKIQKTNVWRLYEALDLGYPAKPGQAVQLAYYDNGVGTSSIRVLAVLGGVFGFGLARNIRDIYKFLCRNYREGDRIYAFGFSRGAYTIRLLVSLVTRMDLVPYNHDERELDFATRDMWREYRRGFHTNNLLTDLAVAIGRDAFSRLLMVKRWLFRQPDYAKHVKGKRRGSLGNWLEHTRNKINTIYLGKPSVVRPHKDHGPDIEFVGVWDTVAAYGGPMVEITRAIDEWIWPLTMPDYRLSPKVKRARHALAIDDKRDSFMPLMWDEAFDQQEAERLASQLKEQGPQACAKLKEKAERYNPPKHPRLQQVWFAGMHSDVGGGYADESLSYVSLTWMMEHAEKAGPGDRGVHFLNELRGRIEAVRNVYGPIHDSRGGMGAFYRYQPRYINAWVDGRPGAWVLPASQTFRDPTTDVGRYRTRGLLRFPVLLHRSVEERLQTATDGYAPNNLPSRYRVDDGIVGIIDPAVQNLADDELENLKQCQLQLGDRIKLRRFWYFVSVALFTALLFKPAWPDIWGLREILTPIDVRTNVRGLEGAANAFLPEMAQQWTAAVAADPFGSLIVVGLLLLTMGLGVGQERSMNNIAGSMWRQRLDPKKKVEQPVVPSGIDEVLLPIARLFHSSNRFAWVLALFKWRIIPNIVGFGLWLFSLWLALALVTQVWLVGREARGFDSAPRAAAQPVEADAWVVTADIAASRTRLGLSVRPGERHSVTIEPLDASGNPSIWYDGSQMADPLGWTGRGDRARAVQALVWPYQRVTTVPLFQPILEARRDRGKSLFDDVHMMRPDLMKTDGNKWVGEFTLPAVGDAEEDQQPHELYFFVNDAAFPIDFAAGAEAKPRLRDGVCVSASTGWTPAMFDLDGRYRNNCGMVRITIKREARSRSDMPVAR